MYWGQVFLILFCIRGFPYVIEEYNHRVTEKHHNLIKPVVASRAAPEQGTCLWWAVL